MNRNQFTAHVTDGDTVVDQTSDGERRLTFRGIDDDGYVHFEDEFGGDRADLASVWQRRFERGDFKLVPQSREE